MEGDESSIDQRAINIMDNKTRTRGTEILLHPLATSVVLLTSRAGTECSSTNSSSQAGLTLARQSSPVKIFFMRVMEDAKGDMGEP